MIAWSRRHTLIAGLALILVVNAIALAGVAYNRSGTPESTLTLSERELQLPYGSTDRKENNGVVLNLRWRVDNDDASPYRFYGYRAGGGTAAWLDEARLTALGFELAQDRNTAERTTKRYRTKEVLLVLELNGAAYRQALERARRNADDEAKLNAANPGNKEFERRAIQAAEDAHAEATENSRLFAVDAGLDAEALRAQYPDKAHYLIARGQIRPQMPHGGQDRLAGYISALSVSQINVPVEFQRALRQDGQTNKPVHFEATVAYGKRLEPWILALTEKDAK